MKSKVLLLFITIISMSYLLMACGMTQNMSKEDTLINCFKNSGAEIVESTISCWSKINDEYMTEKQVTEEMDKVIKHINPDKDSIEKITEYGEEINKEIVYAIKQNKCYTIVIESLRNDTKGETYLIIDVSMDKDCKQLTYESEMLSVLFKDKVKEIKSNSCIIGTYDGKLTQNEIKSKTVNALKSINAKKVEGIETEELNSISAFSNQIGSFILSNNKKINIQIAMRYSSYENKTYIWLGSPLVNVEY